MKEPKYKLNQKDTARYRELVARECLEGVPDPKVQEEFPRLSAKERAELEALQEKRRRKLYTHPRMKESLALQRRQLSKADRLMRKLKALLKDY